MEIGKHFGKRIRRKVLRHVRLRIPVKEQQLLQVKLQEIKDS